MECALLWLHCKTKAETKPSIQLNFLPWFCGPKENNTDLKDKTLVKFVMINISDALEKSYNITAGIWIQILWQVSRGRNEWKCRWNNADDLWIIFESFVFIWIFGNKNSFLLGRERMQCREVRVMIIFKQYRKKWTSTYADYRMAKNVSWLHEEANFLKLKKNLWVLLKPQIMCLVSRD